MVVGPPRSDMEIMSGIHSDPVSISAVVAKQPFSQAKLMFALIFSLQLFSPIGDFICNRLGKISSVRKQNLACFYPRLFSCDDKLS
jgi:hypothetical protein